jgi:hypothetical protein
MSKKDFFHSYPTKTIFILYSGEAISDVLRIFEYKDAKNQNYY